MSETDVLAVEKFGVRFAFGASDRDLLTSVVNLAPPGSTPCPVELAQTRFSLLAQPGTGYRVVLGEAGEETIAGLDLALTMLESAVGIHIASNARDVVFVRAGVVVQHGRAIVLPGASFSGKTTLVDALVNLGAEYYSDEYAVLDGDGLVHPYRTSRAGTPQDPAWLDRHSEASSRSDDSNVPVGDDSNLPVGVLAVVPYRPGGHWHVQQRSAGEGMLTLLANAIPVGVRPGETMHAARHAAAASHVIVGERGEAAEAAVALLDLSAELRP